MDSLREYIICVTAAAIIAGILTGLVDGKSASGTMIRLMAGLFLTFAVISPLVQLELGDLTDLTDTYDIESNRAVSDGEKMAADAMGDIIISQTEAYILDKAQTYDASLHVEVSLDDKLVPAGVRISGQISPYGKGMLQQILKEELGIAEENQTWIC